MIQLLWLPVALGAASVLVSFARNLWLTGTQRREWSTRANETPPVAPAVDLRPLEADIKNLQDSVRTIQNKLNFK